MKKRVTILAGHFGSGKSEIGVNLALSMQKEKNGAETHFIDLDIVKPYFRSRMIRNHLLSTGVQMIIPTGEHIFADLPIVMPQIRGALRNPEVRVIMDVAGDSDGCKVLSSFHADLSTLDHDLLLVVNASRPRTGDAEGNRQILEEIETVSRLRVTGIIANTHLMDETTPEIIREGFSVTEEFARQADLPIRCVVIMKKLAKKMDPAEFPCPVFAIDTYIHPPFGYTKSGQSWQPIVV